MTYLFANDMRDSTKLVLGVTPISHVTILPGYHQLSSFRAEQSYKSKLPVELGSSSCSGQGPISIKPDGPVI